MNCLIVFIKIIVSNLAAAVTLLICFSQNIQQWFSSVGITGIVVVSVAGLLLSILYNIYLIYKMRTDYTDLRSKLDALAEGRVEQIAGQELRDSFIQFSTEIVNNIFKMVSHLIEYPSGTPKINVHYFEYQKTDNGTEYLVKIRKFCYESEPRPDDYPLEKVSLDAKGIVICKAFKNNMSIFEYITQQHIEQYEDNIKDHISTEIRWVLSSPVWKNNHTEMANRKGVVCVFGNGDIPDDATLHNNLKQFCLELSDCIASFV